MPSGALPDQPEESGGEPQPEEAWVTAPEVDLDSEDPALTATGRRICIALTRAGTRCSAPALLTGLHCSAHAGLLDPRAGGLARAQKLRLVADEARDRMITARLGTRAIVAAALAEKHEEIRLAIHELADRAADGDRQAALALLPYMTQALGTPSQAQPETLQVDGEDVDLSALDTASLRALLRTEPPPTQGESTSE
jgi:hypothetical protein